MKLVIIGAGRWAVEVADVAADCGYSIIGWLDDNTSRHGVDFLGARILGPVKDLSELVSRDVALHIAVGHPEARLKLFEFASGLGYHFPPLIHPRATILNTATIGQGCFVGPGAVISSECRLGACVVVHMGCSIGHHSILEDGSFLASGVHSGGGITVSRGAFLCPGVSLVAGVKVGPGAVVSAGTIVAQDVPGGHALTRLPTYGTILTEGNIDWDRVVSGVA